MKVFVFVAAVAMAALPGLASAQNFTPERRAQFVAIMSNHDCRFHNQNPAPELIEELTAAGYERDEIRAIGRDLMETGDGVVEGGALVAKIGQCAG